MNLNGGVCCLTGKLYVIRIFTSRENPTLKLSRRPGFCGEHVQGRVSITDQLLQRLGVTVEPETIIGAHVMDYLRSVGSGSCGRWLPDEAFVEQLEQAVQSPGFERGCHVM